MKRLLLLFLFTGPLFAQYSNNDSSLVKTTFYRIFDKHIIKSYLTSQTTDSVKAALLSVSHSEDTSWVNEITNLNFDLYGDYIAFALGQLGRSKISSNYLYNKILNSNKFLKECFQAYGNTADSLEIKLLFKNLHSLPDNKLTGFPYAFNNYNSRSPLPNKDGVIDFLIKEIEQTESIERKFDALFVLYRLGGSKNAEEILINILNEKTGNYNSLKLKYYALGCLRRISSFPNNYNLFNDLINDNDPGIRVEAARTLCFYEFKNFGEVEIYLSLLKDENPNVSRQAAISIGDLKITDGLKEKLYSKVTELLSGKDLTNNVRGELFVNLCNYKKENYMELINDFDNEIDNDFIYRVLSNNTSSPLENFNYIKGNIGDTTETTFLNIAQAVIPLQDSLKLNEEFNSFLLSILNSSSPLGIALTAAGIDSVIIANNINAIQQIVLEQVFKFYNNKEYLQSMRALYELSKKISGSFADEILQIYKSSQVNWIKTFAKKILNEDVIPGETKNINFDELWNFAFKYSKAKVKTNKGSFIIEFTPQFAPVSVGNFCYLTSLKIFNNCLFHRVVPNFVIQTGDPSSTGWGGPGYEIVSEFSLQPFDEANVGMASSGKDTEGSQWFVMHSSYPHLDWLYTNFGKVIDGMDVVNKIDQKDIILNIELIK